MLNRIHIRNLVIVEALELDLQPGMTTLTGETGAGKSILIDALGLVLGDRADPESIRLGCDRAEIEAEFSLDQLPGVSDWLREQALDSDGECLVRRIIARKGSSRAFINGVSVNLRVLQGLGEQLVDIHGQHAHQSLMRSDAQRDLLDDYAGLQPVCNQVAATYQAWHSANEQLDELRYASRQRSERLELLGFQQEELETLQLRPGEIDELESELQRLSNADRLREGCARLLTLVYEGEQSLHSVLGGSASELADLAESDPTLGEHQALLDEAGILLQEAGRGLGNYLDELESDPQRLSEVESRLSDLHQASRKYRRPAEALPELLDDIRSEREQLENADVHLQTLQQETSRLAASYEQLAAELSQQRQLAGQRLQQEISERMQQLGMQGGRFEIRLEPLGEGQYGPHGRDRLEFLVAANPGQTPQSLARTASGGELSRISLAIQVATAQCNGTPTLIFDEVDVGIGGGIAEIVGRQLHQLGQDRQILCVTHLPQVAAQGNQQLRVMKETRDQQTFTRILPLDPAQRVEEIARMLGGVELTEQSRNHAREMLERSLPPG